MSSQRYKGKINQGDDFEQKKVLDDSDFGSLDEQDRESDRIKSTVKKLMKSMGSVFQQEKYSLKFTDFTLEAKYQRQLHDFSK